MTWFENILISNRGFTFRFLRRCVWHLRKTTDCEGSFVTVFIDRAFSHALNLWKLIFCMFWIEQVALIHITNTEVEGSCKILVTMEPVKNISYSILGLSTWNKNPENHNLSTTLWALLQTVISSGGEFSAKMEWRNLPKLRSAESVHL